MSETEETMIDVTVVPKDDGFNVFVRHPSYSLNTLYLPTVGDAQRLVGALTDAMRDRARSEKRFTVHFQGGPWDGKTYDAERIVAPVFAVGHLIGDHYYLDTKSDPPTYFWDGSEWETVDA